MCRNRAKIHRRTGRERIAGEILHVCFKENLEKKQIAETASGYDGHDSEGELRISALAGRFMMPKHFVRVTHCREHS